MCGSRPLEVRQLRRGVSPFERPDLWSPQALPVPGNTLSNDYLKNPGQRSSHTAYINSDCAVGEEGGTRSRGGWGGSESRSLARGMSQEFPQGFPCPPSALPRPPRTPASDWPSPTSEFRGLKSKDRTARVWTQNTNKLGAGWWPVQWERCPRAGSAFSASRVCALSSWGLRGLWGSSVPGRAPLAPPSPQDCGGAQARGQGGGPRWVELAGRPESGRQFH